MNTSYATEAVDSNAPTLSKVAVAEALADWMDDPEEGNDRKTIDMTLVLSPFEAALLRDKARHG